MVPERFRITLASLVERWFSNVAPGLRKSLVMMAHGVKYRGGYVVRRGMDTLVYVALCELIGHDEGKLLV